MDARPRAHNRHNKKTRIRASRQACPSIISTGINNHCLAEQQRQSLRKKISNATNRFSVHQQQLVETLLDSMGTQVDTDAFTSYAFQRWCVSLPGTKSISIRSRKTQEIRHHKEKLLYYGRLRSHLLQVGSGPRGDVLRAEDHLFCDSASHANIHLCQHLPRTTSKTCRRG